METWQLWRMRLDNTIGYCLSRCRFGRVAVAVDSLAAQAGEDDASVAGFGAPVEALNRGFPQAGDEINRRLAPVLIDILVRTVRGGGFASMALMPCSNVPYARPRKWRNGAPCHRCR